MKDEKIERLYNRLRDKYFKDGHLPDWGDFDFRWTRSKANSAFADVCERSGEVKSLEINQRNAWSERAVTSDLLHELIHLQGGPFLTHGPAFWLEVDRIVKLGALREFF